MKPVSKTVPTKSEQRVYNLIKNAELAKEEWTCLTIAEKAEMSRTNVQLIVQKLQFKGLLKPGHREVVKHDLITVPQAA